MVRPDGVDEVRAIVRPASGAHIGFSPIAPLDGSEAQRQSRMVRDRAAEYGFEYNGSFFFAPRYLSPVYMIAFDRDDCDEAQRAQELVEVLVRDGAAEGYGEYRAHVDFMDRSPSSTTSTTARWVDSTPASRARSIRRGSCRPASRASGRGGAVVAVRQRLDGAGGRARAVRRVLVAGEFRHTSPWSVILALDGLAAPCTTLTVAVVAEHPGCSGLLIAYSTVPSAELRRDLCGGLRRRVQAGALAPPDVRVEHLATDGWRGLERHVSERRYDEVLVGEPPSRLRDRRRVRRAGWRVCGSRPIKRLT